MDEHELAELEMHLAAGTDLPTAFAALPQDKPPRRGIAGCLFLVSFFIVAVLWWLLS